MAVSFQVSRLLGQVYAVYTLKPVPIHPLMMGSEFVWGSDSPCDYKVARQRHRHLNRAPRSLVVASAFGNCQGLGEK